MGVEQISGLFLPLLPPSFPPGEILSLLIQEAHTVAWTFARAPSPALQWLRSLSEGEDS